MPAATSLQIDDIVSLKRNSTTANLDAPAAKRQNRGPLRHHQLKWRPSANDHYQTVPQDEESVSALLERAIVLALEAVGFTGVDPGALQAFRLEAEECRRMVVMACRIGADARRYASFLGRCQTNHVELQTCAAYSGGLPAVVTYTSTSPHISDTALKPTCTP